MRAEREREEKEKEDKSRVYDYYCTKGSRSEDKELGRASKYGIK